jgi:hypothetical protein
MGGRNRQLMTKRLKDISSEELLNSLENETLEVQSSPVYDFIERFALKEGTARVPARLLFNIFLKYYPKTLLFEYFNNEAKLLIPYNERTCEYLLNKESKLLHYEATKVADPAKRTLPNSVAIQRHFTAFFSKLDIKSGEQGVPWFVLYDVYRNYCIDIKFRLPKTFRTFNTYMRFHFKFHNNDYGPAYFISIQPGVLPKKEQHEQIKRKYEITDKKKSF